MSRDEIDEQIRKIAAWSPAQAKQFLSRSSRSKLICCADIKETNQHTIGDDYEHRRNRTYE
jgi:hypothetical protein